MMNDGMLSQEEIDALLNGTKDTEEDTQSHSSDEEEILSPVEKDALGEIGNISFGSSATALSTLLNQKVEITTPHVSVIRKNQLVEEFPKPYVAIAVNYTTGFLGSNLLVINQYDASVIADLMLGGTGRNVDSEIGELQLSAVQEAMNQMMGSAATSMSTIFHKRVEISPPIVDLLNIPEGKGTDSLPPDDYMVKVSFRLIVGDLINSSIMQLLPLPFAKSLVSDLMHSSAEEASATVMVDDVTDLEQKEEMSQQVPNPMYGNTGGETPLHSYQEESHLQRDPVTFGHAGHLETDERKKHVQPAVFSDFSPVHTTEEENRNLQMLFDIPLQVTVELGRTTKVVKEILEMSSGSIIELDKLAGEPVDILVNGKLIAKGEVVVIEENFGVRITDIISQSDRIKNMK
ncbi:flagellar motor switch phosphatase FliY [Caldifermentibacillus hisashii]|uniref:flagellar motor switch phosphatase FliY n=1 Tax=Caldifermentibacillus hisashii TaxID=996558 RepID=UPI0030D654A3